MISINYSCHNCYSFSCLLILGHKLSKVSWWWPWLVVQWDTFCVLWQKCTLLEDHDHQPCHGQSWWDWKHRVIMRYVGPLLLPPLGLWIHVFLFGTQHQIEVSDFLYTPCPKGNLFFFSEYCLKTGNSVTYFKIHSSVLWGWLARDSVVCDNTSECPGNGLTITPPLL